MAVKFYFDEMMSRKAAEQLIKRGYDIVIALDVGMQEKADPEHLAYATENGMILVTFDRKFAGLTSQRSDHAGLICLTGAQDDIGMMVRILSEFSEQHTAESAAGQVFWF